MTDVEEYDYRVVCCQHRVGMDDITAYHDIPRGKEPADLLDIFRREESDEHEHWIERRPSAGWKRLTPPGRRPLQ